MIVSSFFFSFVTDSTRGKKKEERKLYGFKTSTDGSKLSSGVLKSEQTQGRKGSSFSSM